MKSKRQKGSAYELEVEKFLISQGYLCHRARQSYFRAGNKVFTRSNDIFQFDIVAKMKDKPTLWVQVSTGSRRSEKERKIREIGDIWNSQDIVQLWLRFEGGIWKIYQLKDNNFVEVAKIERGKYYIMKGEDDKNE